jgi:hypothetical protein
MSTMALKEREREREREREKESRENRCKTEKWAKKNILHGVKMQWRKNSWK